MCSLCNLQKGANKTPVAAICFTSLLSMAFIFIGQVNTLAPIVTINFMLTYSIIDYSYFCVAMSYNLQVKKTRPLSEKPSKRKPLMATTHPGYGSDCSIGKASNGTLLEFTKDMDQIFPLPSAEPAEGERSPAPGPRARGKRAKVPAKETLMDSFGLDLDSTASALKDKEERDPAQLKALPENNTTQLPNHDKTHGKPPNLGGKDTDSSPEGQYGNTGNNNS